MMVLTVYSAKFDESSGAANGGFSGKAFIDGCAEGKQFGSLDEALDWISHSGAALDRIDFMYEADGEQRFIKFQVNGDKL